MRCKDIMEILEKHSPTDYACEWDNVGLLVGDKEQEIKRIYIALDATDEVIAQAIAEKADMLITHHPMIFGGMKRIVEEDFIGRRIMRLIENHICYYAMHTNFDVLGMAQLAAERIHLQDAKVLEVTARTQDSEEGIGRYGMLAQEQTLAECCELVKEQFGLSHVKVFGDMHASIRKAAISPGSGKSMIEPALEAGVELLITGDINHHEGIDAVACGLNIIDAGHYGLEHIFIEYIQQLLQSHTQDITVSAHPILHPYAVI